MHTMVFRISTCCGVDVVRMCMPGISDILGSEHPLAGLEEEDVIVVGGNSDLFSWVCESGRAIEKVQH